jgi:ankyrin repeat protein
MRGSDLNHCSLKTGWTPIHWAIENNISAKIVKFLLKNGANPHIEDSLG